MGFMGDRGHRVRRLQSTAMAVPLMSNSPEVLWYIPNQVQPGHRGDSAVEAHNSLETLTSHARALEDHGWKGALIGSGWGRPDTFTVAAALAARTTTFE